MKWLTRDRVVPIISARVAWLMFGLIGCGPPSLPKFASNRKQPRKLLLARIEELINQVLFDPAVPGQEMGHEQLGKFRLIVNRGDNRGFRDGRDDAMLHRRCRRNAQSMTVHAALAEKLAGFQNRDDGFLALLGKHGKLDPALLNIKHRVCGFALLEYVLVLLEFKNGLPGPDFRQERFLPALA
jgi:hypothetical protein